MASHGKSHGIPWGSHVIPPPLRPRYIKGAVNSVLFAEFMQTLDTDQRDVVLLDNLSSHGTTLVLDTMAERGLTPCFLPPYTPILIYQ